MAKSKILKPRSVEAFTLPETEDSPHPTSVVVSRRKQHDLNLKRRSRRREDALRFYDDRQKISLMTEEESSTSCSSSSAHHHDDDDDDDEGDDSMDETKVTASSPFRSLMDSPVPAAQHTLDNLDTTTTDQDESAGELASASAAATANAATPVQPLLTELPASKRWRDWWTRTIWTLIMISTFFLTIASGHLYVILMVTAIQTFVFREVISIAHVPSKEKKLPWFRLTNWYFLLVTNYFLYGETLISHFKNIFLMDALLNPLAVNHRFISFTLYVVGFVGFVMNLKKGHYKFQFLQFFWTHMTLLVVIFQSHFIISNILEGLIWFFLPVSFVIANDVFAYICGFFFGRTRLIRLSPKKTWEGFLGGFVCTILFAMVVSRAVSRWPFFICPAKDLQTNAWSDLSCELNPVFLPSRYNLWPAVVSFTKHVFRKEIRYVTVTPLQWHALVMACFASFIAPFGGFFASGFKRAFKLKDFGQSIPGHGGITDRMDCQFLMGLFSFMYYTTFIKTSQTLTGSLLLQQAIEGLPAREQMELYLGLQEYLRGQQLLL